MDILVIANQQKVRSRYVRFPPQKSFKTLTMKLFPRHDLFQSIEQLNSNSSGHFNPAVFTICPVLGLPDGDRLDVPLASGVPFERASSGRRKSRLLGADLGRKNTRRRNFGDQVLNLDFTNNWCNRNESHFYWLLSISAKEALSIWR